MSQAIVGVSRIHGRWAGLLGLVVLGAAPAFVLLAHERSFGHLWLTLGSVLAAAAVGTVPAMRREIRQWFHDVWRLAATNSASAFKARTRLAFLLVVWPAACFMLAWPKSLAMGDSWPVVPTAVALTTQGSLELTSQAASAPPAYFVDGLPYCLRHTPHGVYSGYPQGMVPFAVPTVWAAAAVRAPLDANRCRRFLERWTATWITALTLGLFFLIALELTLPVSALVATAFLGLGSALLTTNSQALWQQTGIAFWTLLIVLIEFRHARRPVSGGFVIQGFAAAMMLACRPSAMVILVPLAGWRLFHDPRRTSAALLVAGLLFLPWAMLNLNIYGTPVGPTLLTQWRRDAWTQISAESLAGVLVSPGRGLLTYQIWIIAPLLAWMMRTPASPRVGPQGWMACFTTIIVLEALLTAVWGVWWGGTCWGSRLLADVVPLAGLLVVPALGRLVQGRYYGTLAALGVAAIVTHWPALCTPALALSVDPSDSAHLWDWSCPPYLAFLRR
ncbi:MAG: hypothetical protein WCL32_04380 [Planctomycetota bacterium]